MMNVYKSLLETIALTGGLLLAGFLLGYDVLNPVIDGILFFSIWSKSYLYFNELEKKK